MKVYFFLTEILSKFELPIESCPISLAFDFKCCSMLLIVIFNKLWISLAAVCPSGPCLTCFASLFGSACAQVVSKINFECKHTVKVILTKICKSFFCWPLWFENYSGVKSSSSSLVGTCLTLPNLGFLWAFFKYQKYPKMGICYFFLWYRCPVCHLWLINFHGRFILLWRNRI